MTCSIQKEEPMSQHIFYVQTRVIHRKKINIIPPQKEHQSIINEIMIPSHHAVLSDTTEVNIRAPCPTYPCLLNCGIYSDDIHVVLLNFMTHLTNR